MRITSKGQVTIPIEIRESLCLLPDTEVEFVVQGNAVVLRKAIRKPRRGKRVIEAMRGRAATRLSTEEIMALTRAE